MIKIFISYSHKDALILERLHTHLSVLKREGKIVGWYDREILAGGTIDLEIAEQLKNSNIFLAIVSPDFLASHYCYELEMQEAIKLNDSGQTRIISIIAEPCDWTNTPLRRFKALPLDGKPIAEWSNANSAYLDIVNELRRITNVKLSQTQTEVQTTSPTIKEQQPEKTEHKTQYRVKRKFDEIDRSDFREKSFKIIREYMQEHILEIDQLEDVRARFSEMDNQGFTCTVLNNAKRNATGNLTVHAKSNLMMGDITYSYSANAPTNTSNGSFTIDATDFDLHLRHGFAMFNQDKNVETPLQAAEFLWKQLLERASIEIS